MRSHRRAARLLVGLAATPLVIGCSIAVTPTPPADVAPQPSVAATPNPTPTAAPTLAPTSSPSPSPSRVGNALSVSLVLFSQVVDFSDPTDCAGTGEWADFRSGADVVVADAAGVELGSAPLSEGAAKADHCRFEVTVDGLPELPTYMVKFGQHGMYPIDLADLETHNTFLFP
jgi:hypothetical protein